MGAYLFNGYSDWQQEQPGTPPHRLRCLLVPIVGLCIGIIISLFSVLFSTFFPPFIADALVLVVSIAITGALHLDGFADTCDGVWGGQGQGNQTVHYERQPYRKLWGNRADLSTRP